MPAPRFRTHARARAARRDGIALGQLFGGMAPLVSVAAGYSQFTELGTSPVAEQRKCFQTHPGRSGHGALPESRHAMVLPMRRHRRPCSSSRLYGHAPHLFAPAYGETASTRASSPIRAAAMKAAEASVRAMASRISRLQRCARNRAMRPETTPIIAITHKHTGGAPLARVLLAARQKGTEMVAEQRTTSALQARRH